MAAGHSFEGASGKNYTFALTDTSALNYLPKSGGLIIITDKSSFTPEFIGAAASLQGAFMNIDKFPKPLPAPMNVYLLPMNEGLTYAHEDLLANYHPKLNATF